MDIPVLAAQTLAQDSHLRHNPDPAKDIAPSTAADKKEYLEKESHSHSHPKHDHDHHDDDDDEEDEDNDAASISSSVLHDSHLHRRGRRDRRPPHRTTLPPLPDLRFEQSYLASIAPARGDPLKITLITLRDQVLFPLFQGTLFSLGLLGWRAWNRRARFMGKGVGARVRRWWWGVNRWGLPEA